MDLDGRSLDLSKIRMDISGNRNLKRTFFVWAVTQPWSATIDQTFAFPRKVEGKEGWGYINLRGMKDSPNTGYSEGEILSYLRSTGGGNEFRENEEMERKWFDKKGQVMAEKIKKADVYELITPSPDRALKLNKAYKLIVKDQDYIHGRDATIKPLKNVYSKVNPDEAPVLPSEKIKEWDLRLNW